MKNKFRKGKIYMLVSDQTDKVYIGSTCNKLVKRLYQHVSEFRRFQRGKCHYLSSFDIIEAGNARIVILEDYPSNNKTELLLRENYWINKYKNIAVNRQMAITDQKEYKRRYDKLKEWCPYCHKEINKHRRSYHFKSKKHQEAVENSNTPTVEFMGSSSLSVSNHKVIEKYD